MAKLKIACTGDSYFVDYRRNLLSGAMEGNGTSAYHPVSQRTFTEGQKKMVLGGSRHCSNRINRLGIFARQQYRLETLYL